VFDALTSLMMTSFFFLQGARLSRDAIATGAKTWQLHLGISLTTFVLFLLLAKSLFKLSPAY
jgi:sodium/bile acid cotransporter 7